VLRSILDTTVEGYVSKTLMQMYHTNNHAIFSGHYVLQVVVESQIKINSLSCHI